MRNELDKETSPYLLQHRDNPVHWQTWSETPLPHHAKRTSQSCFRRICGVSLVSCHGPRKFRGPRYRSVDERAIHQRQGRSEERPDLDMIYQAALAITGQQGGWPLTMFLTPEGAPFWGGTYFPPDQRYGRPASEMCCGRSKASIGSILSAFQTTSQPLHNAWTLSLPRIAALHPADSGPTPRHSLSLRA